MIVHIGERRIVIPEELEASISEECGANALTVFGLAREWIQGRDTFIFQSSGSSGVPGSVELSRALIEWSAANTSKALGTTSEKALLCLPASRIGGAMLVFRSLMLDWQLVVMEPSMNPMSNVPVQHDYTLVSLVPSQLYSILEDADSLKKLFQFKHVLIGGEPLLESREQKLLNSAGMHKTRFYHTYGMTETASHVALRPLGDSLYQAFEGVNLQLGSDSELHIRIPELKFSLQTGDRAEIQSDGRFRLLGRNRFVVNSAGLKISLEEAEHEFTELLVRKSDEFLYLWKEEDDKLGERLVLMTNLEIPRVEATLRNNVTPYHIPKRFYLLDKPIFTESGKPDRVAMHRLALSRNPM